MIEIQIHRLTESGNRLLRALQVQERRSATVVGFDGVFTSVETAGIGDGELTLELVEGIRGIVLRHPDEPQLPMQAQRGIPPSPADLPILDGGSVPEHRL